LLHLDADLLLRGEFRDLNYKLLQHFCSERICKGRFHVFEDNVFWVPQYPSLIIYDETHAIQITIGTLYDNLCAFKMNLREFLIEVEVF
jgi:hypothetical protein